LVKNSVFSAVADYETGRCKGEQLTLDCSCAAVDMPRQLPDEEVRIGFGVKSGKKPTPRPSKQQVPERCGLCAHYEYDCTHHEYALATGISLLGYRNLH
jgi:hypothetical protein